MNGLVVLTPTYRPDVPALMDLHRSVLKYTDDSVVHHVILPAKDLHLLDALASPRLKVSATAELLPRSFVSTYQVPRKVFRNPVLSRISRIQAVNLMRPWPPIRGWIIQQIVKLAAVAESENDVVLIVDSDVVLIHEISAAQFVKDGCVRFYRKDDGINASMSDHRRWTEVAQSLLGVPAADLSGHLPDYVSPFLAMDPKIILEIRRMIEVESGRDWRAAIGGQLAFSECMLYGVWVDQFGTDAQRSFSSDSTRCLSYWDPVPLDHRSGMELLKSMRVGDLAVQIQSTSNTPVDVRLAVIRGAEELATGW